MQEKLKVTWMHCTACELVIEDKLNKIPWVKVKNISKETWELNIETDKNNIEEIKKTIKELWYDTGKKAEKNNFLDYIIIFLIFIVTWLVIFLFKDIEIFTSFVNSQNYSLWMVVLIWIIASMSSCLAITWWIVLWLSNYISKKNNLKIQTSFHIWRLLWFFLLWWILWIIWSAIWTIWIINKILLFVSWILMIYMWLNIVNILPSITKYWLKMPKIFWKKILNFKNPALAPIVWFLTFFLPCWFTQSMQVYASSSWSFLSWGIIMLAFGIWTLPVLFLIWIWNNYFKDKNFSFLNKIIWVLVIYFWIFMLLWFSNLVNLNAFSLWNKEIINNSEIQEISISHDWIKLNPEKIFLNNWKNYKLKIFPENNWLGCMYTLTVPWIDEKSYKVQRWIPIIIDVINKNKWTYKVVCSTMWKEHGEIIIN